MVAEGDGNCQARVESLGGTLVHWRTLEVGPPAKDGRLEVPALGWQRELQNIQLRARAVILDFLQNKTLEGVETRSRVQR